MTIHEHSLQSQINSLSMRLMAIEDARINYQLPYGSNNAMGSATALALTPDVDRPWHSGETRPKAPGVYETNHADIAGPIQHYHWNGSEWRYVSHKGSWTASNQDLMWRNVGRSPTAL